MRHAIAGNRLGRNSSLRKATIRDIAKATLVRQRITTTQAIAKEGRKMVERLITLGKKGTLSDKRRAFAILCDHQLVSDLFGKIAPRFTGRQGGYTRIIPLGFRRGDNARLVFLELTEKEEILPKPKSETSKKKKTVDVESQPGEETPKKPEAVKTQPQKHKPADDKAKPKTQFGSGLKKIFQRKVGGE